MSDKAITNTGQEVSYSHPLDEVGVASLCSFLKDVTPGDKMTFVTTNGEDIGELTVRQVIEDETDITVTFTATSNVSNIGETPLEPGGNTLCFHASTDRTKHHYADHAVLELHNSQRDEETQTECIGDCTRFAYVQPQNQSALHTTKIPRITVDIEKKSQ